MDIGCGTNNRELNDAVPNVVSTNTPTSRGSGVGRMLPAQTMTAYQLINSPIGESSTSIETMLRTVSYSQLQQQALALGSATEDVQRRNYWSLGYRWDF